MIVQISATVPGLHLKVGDPAQGPAQIHGALAVLDSGQARQEVEVDSEPVCARSPLLDPEQHHPHEHHYEVARRERGERRRNVTVEVDQLKPPETDQASNGGPHPKPGGVAQGGSSKRAGGDPSSSPTQETSRRSPRAEHTENVAEQHTQQRETDPEDDVDERDREVRVRYLRTREAAVEHQREQRHPDHVQQRLKTHRQSKGTP